MNETKWLTDGNGNKCSVDYFGTEKAAQTALDSLKGCRDCVNCSGCSDCSDCSRCSDCSDCSDCSRCSDCSGCSRCSRCSDCSGCSGCSDLKNAIPTEDTHQRQSLQIPQVADLDRKVYEAASAPGALAMGGWHTCEKKHCRAGWIVTIAGPDGKALENFYNTELAAMLIYHNSTGRRIHPARFYDSDEAALADMKALAEAQ